MGNPVVHFEIGCQDAEETQSFYSELFGWQIDANPEVPSAMIATGADSGIQGHITSLGHEPHQYVTVYIQVEDLQACLDRAESLGGTTVIPPVEIPGGQGSFAWMNDPGGNLIGLFKPAE